MNDRTVLAARSVTRRFGAVTALDGVSFELRAGEIHALCGENGAGKSTLIKLLSGVHAHGTYDGDIVVDDRVVEFRSTRDAERAGIAIIHQELALFPEMTVGENLFLGAFPQRLGRIDWDRVYAQSSATLAECGIQLDPATRVGDLGIGQQQLVEIARAIARQPKVLVLDEPTAALSRIEIDLLLAQLRRLRARGVACVFISHKLDEVFTIADRITVLRDGVGPRHARSRGHRCRRNHSSHGGAAHRRPLSASPIHTGTQVAGRARRGCGPTQARWRGVARHRFRGPCR